MVLVAPPTTVPVCGQVEDIRSGRDDDREKTRPQTVFLTGQFDITTQAHQVPLDRQPPISGIGMIERHHMIEVTCLDRGRTARMPATTVPKSNPIGQCCTGPVPANSTLARSCHPPLPPGAIAVTLGRSARRFGITADQRQQRICSALARGARFII